jgi:hypothetical protein
MSRHLSAVPSTIHCRDGGSCQTDVIPGLGALDTSQDLEERRARSRRSGADELTVA